MAPAASHDPHAGRGYRWAQVAFVVILLGVYAPSLSSPFLFDDTVAVTQNPTIRRLDSWLVLFPPADGSTTTGRPVVNLSLALNYAVSGDHVWGYHAVNLAIHIAAGLTLMGLVRRTLRAPAFHRRFEKSAGMLAFFCASLWALHPLQTETVVCVAQRTESLCSLFYLFTLYALCRGVAPDGELKRGWLIASVVSCAIGMGAKEVMVTAPVLVLLYDRTFLAGSWVQAWRQRKSYYVALAAAWLVLAALLYQTGGTRGDAAGFGRGVSSWSYLLQQCEALILYLRLSVWPHPLVLDYGTGLVTRLSEVWWQAILIVGLLTTTACLLWRRPIAGFFGAWFFIILAPSSSIVPLITQTMAEHRMYLPLAAITCGAVLLAARFLPRWMAPVLGLVAVGLATITVDRINDYESTVSIWSDTVAKRPSNARAYNNLAWAQQAQGDTESANKNFQRAIELQPSYVSARYNWGVALLDQHRFEAAISQFEAAVKLAPAHADAWVNLGNALVQAQRPADAVRCFDEALRLKPSADIHYNLGIALIDSGRFDAAGEHLNLALTLDPTLALAHFQLGRLAEKQGDSSRARTAFEETLQRFPDYLPAHRRLGLLLAKAEDWPGAEKHFVAITKLAPDDADALANLGNVYLVQGQRAQAITAYESVLRVRPDDVRARENLALARESAP